MRLQLGKLVAACALVVPMTMVAAPAQAAYPEQPVRWIVPYPPGGGSDAVSRMLGETITRQSGQPVNVENRPGGSTSLAAAETARAKPDGYTVLWADNATLVFNPALYKRLSYNPETDLAPVALLGSFPMVLVVSPNSGIRNLDDLIERARAEKKRGGLAYASAGAGGAHHLAMELLNSELDLGMTSIPYTGAGPALADLAKGQANVMMVDIAAGARSIQEGKVRPVAVASTKRLPQLPDVPTFAELGYPNIVASVFASVATTGGTPGEVIQEMHQAIVKALNEPAVMSKLTALGIQGVGDAPLGATPEQMQAMLQSERARWQKLIKDRNISLD